jgi:hypothetical protein
MSLFAFIVLLIFPPLSGLVDNTNFSYLAYIPVAALFALFTPFCYFQNRWNCIYATFICFFP